MTQKWKYQFGENVICVKNWFLGSELIINGTLQDSKNGISVKDELKGTLPGGEIVKVTLCGKETVECSLWINDILQQPVEVE